MTTSIDLNSARRRSDYDQNDGASAAPSDPTANEREERAAARERYESLVSQGGGDAETPDPCDFWGPGPRGSEAVPNSALFLRQGADATAIDLHDVRQGQLGDCYVLATLGGLTRTPEGRAVIHNAIQENRTRTGDVISYTVLFHDPIVHRLGFGPTTFADVRVTVSAAYVAGHARARMGDDGAASEVWPLVMERAYAAYAGQRALCGGTPSRAMQVITGKEAEHIALHWYRGSYSSDRLARDLAAGKIVVVGTKDYGRTINQNGLIGRHAYLVTGTQFVGSKLCVVLHNPWDESEPDPVPFDEVKRWFEFVDVGTVK